MFTRKTLLGNIALEVALIYFNIFHYLKKKVSRSKKVFLSRYQAGSFGKTRKTRQRQIEFCLPSMIFASCAGHLAVVEIPSLL